MMKSVMREVSDDEMILISNSNPKPIVEPCTLRHTIQSRLAVSSKAHATEEPDPAEPPPSTSGKMWLQVKDAGTSYPSPDLHPINAPPNWLNNAEGDTTGFTSRRNLLSKYVVTPELRIETDKT
ncbi:hypothetical protein IAQ61_006083 [Plenodomus lingam]|uniref:uncharacterized protein n=1 Tax=Leptosphaeria maculans TaxID=5022 RepID=UPI003316BCEC|nr:hypothetical protein IAQ61_006083 [Plenodomus lingam]